MCVATTNSLWGNETENTKNERNTIEVAAGKPVSERQKGLVKEARGVGAGLTSDGSERKQNTERERSEVEKEEPSSKKSKKQESTKKEEQRSPECKAK